MREKSFRGLSSLLVLVAFWVTCASARPQRRDVVLNIAASAVPKWKLDVYGEFAELGFLLGDKSKPINTIEDLSQVISASNYLWTKYCRDKWSKKFQVFKDGSKKKPPNTAIHMVARLMEAVSECDFEGYKKLITAYDAAVGKDSSNENYLEAKDQVKSAVIAAISLHGATCRDTYYNRYKEVYDNEIHEYMLGLMDFLFDRRFLGRVLPGKGSLITIGSASRTAFAVNRFSNLLLDKLITMVENTEYKQYILVSSKEDFDSEKFETEIVKPLLIQPCEEFTEPLNDIFYPAMIDLAPDDEKITEINYKNDLRFVDIWKKFIICSAIHQNREEVINALRMSALMRCNRSEAPTTNK